ncbi:MAG: response regulator [Tissierellaceae bacterium]
MINTIMIIDDDINIIQMLKTIITKNKLGKVVADLNSGEYAIEEILFYNPDIVLIDYLLPHKDGVEIIKGILENGYSGKIIMISQVEDEPMISNAYNTGILFFIKKPINSIEVTNIIKNVSQSIELEKSMSMIKSLLGNVGQTNTNNIVAQKSSSQKIEEIMSDLGIIGELGSPDLIKLIEIILEYRENTPKSQYMLQDLYEKIANEESNTKSIHISPSAIEQRIRRTIQKSLSNIAEMGLDDYYNAKFTEYSILLFDFKQVKQEMAYIENRSNRRGKINIRKFIEGIISKIEL